jgi:hypothetical protein
MAWMDASDSKADLEIRRAADADFTVGVTTHSVNGNVTAHTTGNLPKGANYYFRASSGNASGISDWVNATPFPIVRP